MAPKQKKQKHTTGKPPSAQKKRVADIEPKRGSMRKRTRRPPSPPKAKDRLSSLPAELRNKIYYLALVDLESGETAFNRYWSPAVVPRWHEPGLLQASKMSRAEAYAVYYGNNNLKITVRLLHFRRISAWLAKMVERCGKKPFRACTIDVCGRMWDHLLYIYPFIQMLRTTGLELPMNPPTPCARSKGLGPTCFHASGGPDVTAAHMLKEAYDLGRKANTENWTEEWLELEFGWWLDGMKVVPVGKHSGHKFIRARGE